MAAASASRSGIISLLTDFGLRDNYVGQMKGVILALAPGARLVDLSHLIPAQDVLEGAFQLATAWQAFPEGTVHLAVVDPGVGTSRRALAVRAFGHYFVAPDNGLLSLAIGPSARVEAVALDPARVSPRLLSGTFHGRDLFAPAAARLAAGITLTELGDPVEEERLVRLPLVPVVRGDAMVSGPVVSIDHFGNCRTLIAPEDIPWPHGRAVVGCAATRLTGIRHTYGDVEAGSPLALYGSHGGLEIAVRDGNASDILGIALGEIVWVRLGIGV